MTTSRARRTTENRRFLAVALCLALGTWSCTHNPQPIDHPSTVVSVPPPPAAVTTPERTPLVSFEGEAKTGVPPQVVDFVTRFFESMEDDWRRGIQFMNRENYQEMRANDPKLDPVTGDAVVLVLSISLHRFYGSGDPPDTDSDVERLKAISKVRIDKFEQDEQVFRIWGETKLKDGRVYGLTLVITRNELSVVGPL